MKYKYKIQKRTSVGLETSDIWVFSLKTSSMSLWKLLEGLIMNRWSFSYCVNNHFSYVMQGLKFYLQPCGQLLLKIHWFYCSFYVVSSWLRLPKVVNMAFKDWIILILLIGCFTCPGLLSPILFSVLFRGSCSSSSSSFMAISAKCVEITVE